MDYGTPTVGFPSVFRIRSMQGTDSDQDHQSLVESTKKDVPRFRFN